MLQLAVQVFLASVLVVNSLDEIVVFLLVDLLEYFFFLILHLYMINPLSNPA